MTNSPLVVEYKPLNETDYINADEFCPPDEKRNLRRCYALVVDAVVKTNRFSRTTKGKLLFSPDPSHPRDFIALTRTTELQSIIDSELVIRITGGLSDDEKHDLCKAIFDNRWRLPLASSRPEFLPLSVLKS
jgi:hypothetical protein